MSISHPSSSTAITCPATTYMVEPAQQAMESHTSSSINKSPGTVVENDAPGRAARPSIGTALDRTRFGDLAARSGIPAPRRRSWPLSLAAEHWFRRSGPARSRIRLSHAIAADLSALDEIASLFRELASLPVLPDDLPFSESWGTTVALAVAHRLTSYDASYLELPRRTHLPLATFDQALRRAAEAEAIPLANLVP